MMVLLERSLQGKKAESVQHTHCLILIQVDAARSALYSNHTTKENKSIYLPCSSKNVSVKHLVAYHQGEKLDRIQKRNWTFIR